MNLRSRFAVDITAKCIAAVTKLPGGIGRILTRLSPLARCGYRRIYFEVESQIYITNPNHKVIR
jgi:hypothetical protein